MPVRERCHNRELFGPWLLRNITSSQYEGVYWLDEGHTLFRLPWKHLNMRNVDENDYAIFKAWAIQSRKYNPLCEDPPTYKTNFRCALKAVYNNNGKMFSEVRDNSSDTRDPHKIFRFHGVHEESSPAVDTPAVSHHSTIEENNFHNEIEHDEDYRLRISPVVEHTTPFINRQDPTDIEQLLRDVLLDSDEHGTPYQVYGMYQNGHIENLPAVDQVFQQIPACPQLLPAPPVCNFVEAIFDDVQTCEYVFQQESTQHMVNNEATTHCNNNPCNTDGEMSASQSSHDSTPSTFNDHGSTESPETASTLFHQEGKMPKLTSWEVTVYYRGKEVLKQNVSTKFYINYTGHVPQTEPAELVTFPPTADTLVDQVQIEYTDKILNSVGNGLLLDVSPHDRKLYATRMGNSRVYWGMSESLETRQNVSHAMKLDRNVPTGIFDFNHFTQELKAYTCHERSSPDFTLYLSFGQSLFEPIKKALVLVKLVPSFCTFWHQIAQQEGASSLRNEELSLQISNGISFNGYDVPCLMDLDLSDFPGLF
ncbi:PREDICTED: interferon regulatory factor 7-like [Nanorana parkeri]|uniref:interferon regulatory factor 7-like n=1 Tax=Nanorana parkeri TaxID=125878 RepID=UPI0008549601|nr:PREDICTED: interferon regulatory factor 7-like [Nanorana parkeri]